MEIIFEGRTKKRYEFVCIQNGKVLSRVSSKGRMGGFQLVKSQIVLRHPEVEKWPMFKLRYPSRLRGFECFDFVIKGCPARIIYYHPTTKQYFFVSRLEDGSFRVREEGKKGHQLFTEEIEAREAIFQLIQREGIRQYL